MILKRINLVIKTMYSRMNQEKFFKCCLSQILLGPFLIPLPRNYQFHLKSYDCYPILDFKLFNYVFRNNIFFKLQQNYTGFSIEISILKIKFPDWRLNSYTYVQL